MKRQKFNRIMMSVLAILMAVLILLPIVANIFIQ